MQLLFNERATRLQGLFNKAQVCPQNSILNPDEISDDQLYEL